MSDPIKYYVSVGEERKGPYTLAQLQTMWRAASLTLDTQYWFEGQSEWMPLSTILELLEAPASASPRYAVPPNFLHTPPKPRSGVGMVVRLGCAGALAIVVFIALIAVFSGGAEDDARAFIAIYGPADKEESTEYDTPRPPIVTRFLTYEPEHVVVLFVPEAKITDPPPYSRWKHIGFQDSRDNHVIKLTEVEERLRSRKGRR